MQNTRGSLNFVTYQSQFFFYTTLPQLLQEITYLYRKKYFWDVTKVQLKAFSKYHYNPISVFVIINLELYGFICAFLNKATIYMTQFCSLFLEVYFDLYSLLARTYEKSPNSNYSKVSSCKTSQCSPHFSVRLCTNQKYFYFV